MMRLAKSFVVLALLCVPALAQDIAPTTPSNFLNILLSAVAGLLTTVIIPLAYLWGRGLIAERQLKNAQLQEQLRGAANSGVQKAVAGELAMIDIPEGKLTGRTREQVINGAGAVVARNFSETLTGLGIADEDKLSKGKEMVATTLGLMDAQAAGNPVPNPSQPITAPALQSVTVTGKK